MKKPAIYIISNQKNGTIYTGVTSDLIARIYQHKNNLLEGFSKKYGCKNLVYYELFEVMDAAIAREKQLKNWKREWKIALIEKDNLQWRDLYEGLL